MKESDVKFKLKDKIFLFLAITGLILAFYFRIFDSGVNQNDKYKTWIGLSDVSQEEFSDGDEIEMRIRERIFKVEIARSDEKKYQGLSGRDFLEENKGMLFLFSENDKHSFVMRDMNMNLDFIFINNGRVVELIKNIPSNFEGSLRGENEYDRVIEMNAGWLDQNGIIIGDNIFVKNN